jgi:hypothetical protein
LLHCGFCPAWPIEQKMAPVHGSGRVPPLAERSDQSIEED